jgi:hypothetical protein
MRYHELFCNISDRGIASHTNHHGISPNGYADPEAKTANAAASARQGGGAPRRGKPCALKGVSRFNAN